MEEKLQIEKYKKGQTITAGIYINFPVKAGAKMMVVNAYGIYADVFDREKYYHVPNVQSKKPGSGKFYDFLLALKKGLDKPVYFTTITNQGIYKYLEKADIGVVVYDSGKPMFYNVKVQKQ